MCTRLTLVVFTSLVAVVAPQAADPIVVPLSTNSELPLYEVQTFDWSGLYAGLNAGGQGAEAGVGAVLGAQLGVQAQFDFYLIGAEVAVRGVAGGAGADATAYADILGRAGVIANDSLLVYTAAGYGLELDSSPKSQLVVGGGLEVPVAPGVTFDARYLHRFSDEVSESADVITFGANWHF